MMATHGGAALGVGAGGGGRTIVALLFSLLFFHSLYFSSSRFLPSPLNLYFSLLLFFLLSLPSLVLNTLSPQSFPLLCSSLLSIFLMSFSFFLLLSSSFVFIFASVFFSVLSLSSLSSCSSKHKNMPLGSLCFSSLNVPCFSVLSSLFVFVLFFFIKILPPVLFSFSPLH